ncbi:MAG: hypothetical protein ACM3TR_03225 [Caulobacteraceae bacterium]
MSKKLLSLFLVFTIAFTTFIGTVPAFAYDGNNSSKAINEPYQYPITPTNTEEWAKLTTLAEKKEACQIPLEIAENMTTEALIETVLSYPLLPPAALFNDPKTALDGYMDFNALSELFSREGVPKLLIEMYSKINISKAATNYEERTKMNGIEVLLGSNEIIEKMSDSQLDEMAKTAVKKYKEKKAVSKGFSGSSLSFFKGLDMPVQKQEKLFNNSEKVDESQILISATGVYEYVQTPNGTDVEVYKEPNNYDGQEISYWDEWVKTNYPNTTLIASASTAYNCHSYAWYLRSYSNPYWMNDPSAYMTDGSYTAVSGSIRQNDKIYYDGEHSGIVYTANNTTLENSIIESKWGSLGVVRHKVYDSPYTSDGYFFR